MALEGGGNNSWMVLPKWQTNKTQDLKLTWTKECPSCAYKKLPHATKVYVQQNGVGCCEVSQD
jgi:hypothetical protein